MPCKFSDGECCQKVDVWCKGEAQDKAECPEWSGGIKPQTYIKK